MALAALAALAGIVASGCGGLMRPGNSGGSANPYGYSSSRYYRYQGSGGLPPTQIVRASWYGQEFANRKTSSGERFNPNALTAASRTLPLGSVVRVTNLKNGRSVYVRINDHGPYVRGRGLDLSRRAAQEIGMARAGVARVKVTPVAAPHRYARHYNGRRERRPASNRSAYASIE